MSSSVFKLTDLQQRREPKRQKDFYISYSLPDKKGEDEVEMTKEEERDEYTPFEETSQAKQSVSQDIEGQQLPINEMERRKRRSVPFQILIGVKKVILKKINLNIQFVF